MKVDDAIDRIVVGTNSCDLEISEASTVDVRFGTILRYGRQRWEVVGFDTEREGGRDSALTITCYPAANK